MKHEFGSNGKGTYFQVIGPDFKPEQHLLITVTSQQGEASYLVTNQSAIATKSRFFVQAPKERIEIKRNPKLSAFLKYAQFVGYGMLGILVLFSGLNLSGTIQTRVVLTGSMAPAINPGDIVVTVPLKAQIPQIGDIVTYQARRFNGEGVGVFTHRIISGTLESGYMVKGDHNPSPDIQKVTKRDILGIVVFRIPYIGHLITPRALAILVPTIIGLWLIIDSMMKA